MPCAASRTTVLSSAALDNRAFEEADKGKNSRWVKRGVEVGNALPIAAMGLSGVFALDDSRPALSDAGVAALEAGALAFWLERIHQCTRRAPG